MNLLNVDTLNKDMLNKLYQFLIKPNNFLNKQNISNIIWNIIYLHKILVKSIRSKRSKKEQINFNYIITNANSKHNEIICFFTFHFPKGINSKSDIPLLLNFIELSVIIDPKYNFTDIFHIIINQYQKLCEELVVNNHELHASNILCIYIPLEKVDINNALVDCQFELAFKDNSTFRKEYFIYYKFYESISSLTNKDYKNQRNNKITSGDIIGYIMNYYGLNKVLSIQPDKIMTSASSKLTRKSVQFGEIKMITRNIMDIKELQDLPEYDYDYNIIYTIRIPNYFYSYDENTNIDSYVKNRFFSNNIINYDKDLFEIYKNFTIFFFKLNIQYIRKNLVFKDLETIFKKYNIGLFFNRFMIDNYLIVENTIKNNALILTSSDIEINKFNDYKCDIIYCKQQLDYEIIYKSLIKKNKTIKKGFTTKDLTNSIDKNKTYDNIYINNSYINYDYLIASIYLQIKLPYFINLLLVPLRSLNNNGNMIIKLFVGNNLKLPIMIKLFSIIVSLFNTYEILFYFANSIIFIRFINFDRNKYKKYEKHISAIIYQISNYENLEYSLGEMKELLLTNKFYYKLDVDNIGKQIKKKQFKHILTDIKLFSSCNDIIDKIKSNNFINEYNSKTNLNKQLNIQLYNEVIHFIKIPNIDNEMKLNDIITKYFDIKLLILLNLMRLNKLLYIDINIIKGYIEQIFIKYKNINSYFKQELLDI